MQAYSDALPISTIHTKSKETKHERERSHCNTLKLSLNSASDRSHLNLFLHNVRNDQASPAMIDMTG
jgi:hypothetical protein